MSDRPSISVTGKFYEKLQAYAIKHDLSIANIVERAVAKDIGLEPPEIRRPSRRYRGPKNG